MFGRGLGDYAVDNNAVAQNLKTRLLSFKDDWFLSVDAGVDYFNLLGYNGRQEFLINAISNTILGTYGVIKITELKTDIKERKASIVASVLTIFDEIVKLELGVII
jgi:hypothetical protein